MSDKVCCAGVDDVNAEDGDHARNCHVPDVTSEVLSVLVDKPNGERVVVKREHKWNGDKAVRINL